MKAVAEIFQVPVALISLVGAERIFYKAAVGMGNMRSGGRGQGLCALGVLKPECTVIPNALNNPILDKNPLVHGHFGLRFYAGAPLITHDGFLIGTVCIVDNKPRMLSKQKELVLTSMASVVMEQIELRLANLLEIEKQKQINLKVIASEKQKDEFISMASHELKTPVTSLKMAMQVIERLKDNSRPEVLSKMIAQANKNLDKLTSLVSDLLDSNRISQGQLHLRKTNFVISGMINECCDHISVEHTHGIMVEGDLDLEIIADEQQIEQVVVNLVNNAIKYAPNAKQITIRIESSSKEAKVSVIDQGSGIPNDKIPHLFERYYRVNNSGIEVSGLGLGLYISSEIIKKHGGEIGVDTEDGKGCTFWFSLPFH